MNGPFPYLISSFTPTKKTYNKALIHTTRIPDITHTDINNTQTPLTM